MSHHRSIFVDTSLIVGDTLLKEPVLSIVKEKGLIVKLTHIQIDEKLGMLAKEVQDYNRKLAAILDKFKCYGLNIEMVAAPAIFEISRLNETMVVTNWMAKYYYEFVGRLVVKEGIFVKLLKGGKLEEAEIEKLGKKFRSIVADASILLSAIMHGHRGDIFATGDKNLYQIAKESQLELSVICVKPDDPNGLKDKILNCLSNSRLE